MHIILYQIISADIIWLGWAGRYTPPVVLLLGVLKTSSVGQIYVLHAIKLLNYVVTYVCWLESLWYLFFYTAHNTPN